MIWKRTKLKYGSVFTSLFLALVTGFVFTITANPQTPEVLAGYVSTAQLNSANNNGQPTEPKPDVGFTGELVDEYDYDKTEIIAEDTSKRTATSKTFVMADGTYVWQEYATPVHFLRDGEFREIDNTLNASLTNTANDFKVSFGQAQDDNLVRVSSQQNQYQTSVGLVPAFGTDRNEIASLSVFDGNRKLDAGRSNTLTESQATRAATLEYSTNYSSSLNELNIKDSQLNNRLQNAFTKQNSSVYYSDLYNDIDIQYILEGQSLKENIIVHAPLSSYDFRFELNLTNLFPHKTFEGDILLIDIVTLETVYIIPRGFMFDADGVYSYDVEYELEQTGSTWFLIVSACPEFFQTAQFPVTVDPTIYHGGNSNPNYVIGRHKDVESKTSATGSDKFEHWHEKFIW
ncbi:MAG: hypothetical protein FWE53_05270, partial [Firmicutes bacterium]|nr:hypothetical protein [Bacillota bacterium]